VGYATLMGSDESVPVHIYDFGCDYQCKSAEAIKESIARFGIKLFGWIFQDHSER
jgi:NADH:ubiquinone oxidoreductase subunit B-like Fe-S oxidoreductase